MEAIFCLTGRILQLQLGDRVVETTSEHPFYVHERGWTPALNLVEGDLILGHDDVLTPVRSVTLTDKTQTVYNLRIEDDHTYFVGARDWGFSVWVHNTYSVEQLGDGRFILKEGDNVLQRQDGIAGDWIFESREAADAQIRHLDAMARGVANAPNTMRGNPALGKLIRDIDAMPVSAAEKVRLITEGAAKIDGITFARIADAPGAKAIFKGSPIGSGPMAGRSPVLVVLEDSRIVKGFDKLHPHHGRYYIIDLGELK